LQEINYKKKKTQFDAIIVYIRIVCKKVITSSFYTLL